MLPARGMGRVRERRPHRPPRPDGGAGPLDRRPHRRTDRPRGRPARDHLPAPVVGDRRVDRPGGAAGGAAARPRLERARDPRASPTTCRPARRTPPSGRRSPRAAATHGSPTAASAARSPSRCARRWTGSAAGSTTSPPPAGRSCSSASAAVRHSPAGWCSTTRTASPARRSCTARCRSTPASRSRRPGWPACRSFVAQGEQDTVIPRELLDRTWDYLLDESGAPTDARRDPGGHGIAARRSRELGGWLPERLTFLARRGAARSRTGDAGRPCPDGTLPRSAGHRPAVSPGRSRRNSAATMRQCELQEQLFARVAALPGVTTWQSAISVPGARGLHARRSRDAGPTMRSWSPPPASSPTCTPATTAPCTWPCRWRWPRTRSPRAGQWRTRWPASG